MTENKSCATAVVIGVVALSLCTCVLVAGIAGYGYYTFKQAVPISSFPEISPNNDMPTTEPEIIRPPVDSVSSETLKKLQITIVPSNDPRELACRLDNKCDVPEVMAASAASRMVGELDNFWVHNLDTNVNTEVQASLRYVTPHVYFWVQDSVPYNDSEMKALVDEFEEKIYPTNREFFGSEWSPGIDGD